MALLGEEFDIHGGGMDLKFPHHENEIAQSCGATGAHFARVWMHNGFVNVDSEKMSKSLGNFFTMREVLPQLRHPEVLRYFLVASHYRGPINYTLDSLAQADATLAGFYNALRGVPAGRTRCRCRRNGAMSSAPRWTTTSIRRRPWRCCRAWRARSTKPRRAGRVPACSAPRNWPRCFASLPGCWASASSTRKPGSACRRPGACEPGRCGH